MKVRELIAELETLDTNLEVICYVDDGLQPSKDDARCLEPMSIDRSTAMLFRGDDGVMRIRFDNERGHAIALVQITGDL